MLSRLICSNISKNFSNGSIYKNHRYNSSAKSSNVIIGIDLGTTNSCVALMEGSSPKVIENSEGSRTTPSVVAILNDKGEILVGNQAKRQSLTNCTNTFTATKRYIGRRFEDADVKKDLKHVPYKLVPSPNGDVWFEAHNKKYSPSQISSYVLMKMKETAESYLGSSVKSAVITVPAYFNDAQRQATKDAGEIANLQVKRIINEPTAAALAFGFDKKNESKKIVVYDLGGGTFDVTVMEMSNGVFEVKSTSGDTRLGGEDFDMCLTNFFMDEFKRQNPGCDISSDKAAVQRIKEAAERAKIELSTLSETEINLPYLTMDKSGSKHFQMKLTRSKFESLVDSLIKRTVAPCEQALSQSGLKKNEIDKVLLVGGMTRVPKVQSKVEEIFGAKPSKEVNPDEAVAIGAAIQGGVLVGDIKDLVLLDVIPLSLGVNTLGGIMSVVVGRNTTIPSQKKQIYTTSEDFQTSVEVEIYQGERTMSKDNEKLGNFTLTGIPPMKKGMPQIEVCFDIDNNAILTVTALEKTSNKQAKVTITSNKRGLSKEQIEKLVEEANQYREQDIKNKEIAELANKSEGLIYDVESFCSTNKEKLGEDTIDNLKKHITELKELVNVRDSVENIKQSMETLSNAYIEALKKVNPEPNNTTQDNQEPKPDDNQKN